MITRSGRLLCFLPAWHAQNCEPLEIRHSVGFLKKTDDGRSCLVETSIKFLLIKGSG